MASAQGSGDRGDAVQVIGRYGDTLRALGHIADSEHITSFEITESDLFLTIAWMAEDGVMRRRSYGESGTADLRRDARLARGTARGKVPSGFAESLRVIGQDLDAEGSNLSSATVRAHSPSAQTAPAGGVQLPGAITVITVTRDQEMATHFYSGDELTEKSRRRRLERGQRRAARERWWSRFFRARPARSA